jgi:Holliday junction DNA helicase RuvA
LYIRPQILREKIINFNEITMIDAITGIFTAKTPTYSVIETASGISYRIHTSLNTYSKIEKLEKGKLLTYFQIKEDAHSLYGFAEEAERTLFTHLISVSGVGATTAQIVLSSMHPEEVRTAILSENEVAFSKVKGIGAKTAKRIILDLKDKMQKESFDPIDKAGLLNLPAKDNKIREEALTALVTLGFVRINVQKALNAILQEKPTIATVEELIKLGLRRLSSV